MSGAHGSIKRKQPSESCLVGTVILLRYTMFFNHAFPCFRQTFQTSFTSSRGADRESALINAVLVLVIYELGFEDQKIVSMCFHVIYFLPHTLMLSGHSLI